MQHPKLISMTRAKVISIFFQLCMISCGAAITAQAQTYSVLFTFWSGPASGRWPKAPVLLNVRSLYGTTVATGTGQGAVYEVSAPGREKLLYTFTGGTDGGSPSGALVLDQVGNLYGTTALGGNPACSLGYACGTVFELNNLGTEIALYSFTGAEDGALPYYGLVADDSGNLYGTTAGGGDSSCGCGVVFELSSAGVFTVLHAFAGGQDGSLPSGKLVLDAGGNVYGTTTLGGGGTACLPPTTLGCGTVFKIDKAGNESVLYSFVGGRDGAQPTGDLVLDAEGNLYGVTGVGADLKCKEGRGDGCGTVFKLDPNGILTVLHTFTGGTDGAGGTGLARDSVGNLYGTTGGGGGRNCYPYELSGCGTVFKLDPTGNETILHAFAGGTDGAVPLGLTFDRVGNLYGTTVFGGGGRYCGNQGCGTIYRITVR